MRDKLVAKFTQIALGRHRRRIGQQRAMLHAPRMQDGSEVLEHGENDLLEQRVERLNAEIARVRAQLERLGSED